MTNREMIIEQLSNKDKVSDAYVSNYIECPNIDVCLYDGIKDSVCSRCKEKWLDMEYVPF